MDSGVTSQRTDDHVFLVGRPPLSEFLGFVTALAAEGQAVELGALANEWRAANDHIRNLETREEGWADSPPIEPLPTEQESLRQLVLSDPVFQRSFGLVPTDIAVVELDRLVVFQKNINLSFVQQLQDRLGLHPSEDDIFRFCLPFKREDPPAQVARVAQNAFMFVSPSNDFRFLDTALLGPQQVTGVQPTGAVVGVVGLVVGYGSNYLSVIHVDGRLVLNNGSHRAFALRERGITHVPCAVQRISRREELEVVSSQELQQHPDRYLSGPRPPVLKDYFDTKLRKIVPVPRRQRQVKISFGVEPLDVPAP